VVVGAFWFPLTRIDHHQPAYKKQYHEEYRTQVTLWTTCDFDFNLFVLTEWIHEVWITNFTSNPE